MKGLYAPLKSPSGYVAASPSSSSMRSSRSYLAVRSPRAGAAVAREQEGAPVSTSVVDDAGPSPAERRVRL